MNPFSHLSIAAQLESDIRPTDRAEYFWGAVAPDVRYAAGMRREQTHLPPEELAALFEKYPQLNSFLQGYLVHRLTDLVPIRALLARRLLFLPILLAAPGRFIPVMLETYYIEKLPLRLDLSGAPNQILRDLRIADEHIHAFAAAIRPLAAAPSFETALGFLRALRQGSAQVEKYAEAARFIERWQFLKPLFFALADLERLNRQVLAALRADAILRKTVFQPASRPEV